MSDRGDGDKLKVVFMCTGNQARSVIAEHYFRKITAGLPVEVESVGLLDIPGAPALPEAIKAAADLSLDLAEHKSRHFRMIDLIAADLVLGFQQEHIAAAVVDGHADRRKSFKLMELVRLIGEAPDLPSGEPVENARTVIAHAASRRRPGNAFLPEEDLDDPAGRNSSFFRDTAARIRLACDAVAGALFPDAPREGRLP